MNFPFSLGDNLGFPGVPTNTSILHRRILCLSRSRRCIFAGNSKGLSSDFSSDCARI